jgi:hypothetical protein
LFVRHRNTAGSCTVRYAQGHLDYFGRVFADGGFPMPEHFERGAINTFGGDCLENERTEDFDALHCVLPSH